ncbi:MAG: protease modulator HflC [Clostridiales bacterium]|jgi:membrane protease subunit HflC|nr:protease modulator HflC [Clostridiales bacterium]
MKKKLISVVLGVILLALVIIVGSSLYVVRENEHVCVVRFSNIEKVVSEPGLHFKIPFVDNLRVFPKAVMLYDIPTSDVLTADKKAMTIDSYLLWRIENPLKFYQSLGTIGVAEERLDALTYNELKNTMGTLDQNLIINQEISGTRNLIYDQIKGDVAEIAKSYGIDVVDIKIKRLDLPSDNEQAVYNRMISERNQIAKKYEADGEYEASIIRNNVDKQVNIIVSDAEARSAELVAEGEAEYMRLLAAAYNTDDKREFFEFLKALEALEASLNGNDKTVILGKDSLLADLLMNP